MARGNDKIYALNRFNFDEQLELLLPRATAYSAGLLNHFFRGKLAILIPSAGVYGIIDHARSNSFNTIKLREPLQKIPDLIPVWDN